MNGLLLLVSKAWAALDNVALALALSFIGIIIVLWAIDQILSWRRRSRLRQLTRLSEELGLYTDNNKDKEKDTNV